MGGAQRYPSTLVETGWVSRSLSSLRERNCARRGRAFARPVGSTHPTQRQQSPVAAPARFSALEQGFRFSDFGQISLRVEINKNWCEQFGYCLGSPICRVQMRKSNCAAQLESLRLLGSRDFQGSAERVFGHGNVRRAKAQQKLTLAAMEFGIEPMLAGL